MGEEERARAWSLRVAARRGRMGGEGVSYLRRLKTLGNLCSSDEGLRWAGTEYGSVH
jgi:hypothetical protein